MIIFLDQNQAHRKILLDCIRSCLGILGVEEIPVDEQPERLLTQVRVLLEASNIRESNLDQRFAELNQAIAQKTDALEHCQNELRNERAEKECIREELQSGNHALQNREAETMTKLVEITAELETTKQDNHMLSTFVCELGKTLGCTDGSDDGSEIIQQIQGKLSVLDGRSKSDLMEARAEVERAHALLSTEREAWNQERQRLMTERLKLAQENGQLKRTPPSAPGAQRPVASETSTESIVKAIEADLMKARKGSSSATGSATLGSKSKVDEKWTVSPSAGKSPLKRAAPGGRISSRKKKLAVSGPDEHHVGRSPLRSQSAASELDFWAFSKARS